MTGDASYHGKAVHTNMDFYKFMNKPFVIKEEVLDVSLKLKNVKMTVFPD